MVTTTKREEAELELAGAQRRLQRAEAELEFHFWARHGDDRQRHWLEVERDEAVRLVMRCRRAMEAYE